MDITKYRVVSFDQDPRLKEGRERRLKIANDGTKSEEERLKAAREYLAVSNAGGICEALALKWLKIKFKENSEDPKWKDFGRLKPADRVALIDRDKTFDKAFSVYMASTHLKGLQDFYGLKADFDLKSLSGLGSGNGTSYVARTVADSTHGYFLHSFKCPKYKDGFHAIAYYTSSGKWGLAPHVYVFDPDFGEYKVPKSKFVKWMPEFVEYCYETKEGDTRWLKVITLGKKISTL